LALRWLATGKRHKARLLLPIELSVVLPVGRASVYGFLKALLDIVLAHSGDGGLAHLHRIGYLLIDSARTLRALVGFEQDASVSELAGRGGASGDQVLKLNSFSVTQDYEILFLHNEHKHTHYVLE